ncbi:MAG: DNA polymerase III subunit delta, partial [Burkholderiales bacterium]|nr:DNA polymerase III subunit delta [Burkholderiales bacterium]
MKIDAPNLRGHLKTKMGSLYVIHGDELLLGLEAADLIRRAAKYKGFEDRIVLVAENRFDWSKLKEQSQSVSLFSTNKVVDLRIPTGKPGKSGSDALQAYVKNIPENMITLITLPGLDRNARNAKWFLALEKYGVSIEVKKVYREQLPNWIAYRLKLQKQTMDQDTLQLLAGRVEGNLIAAHQEILK